MNAPSISASSHVLRYSITFPNHLDYGTVHHLTLEPPSAWRLGQRPERQSRRGQAGNTRRRLGIGSDYPLSSSRGLIAQRRVNMTQAMRPMTNQPMRRGATQEGMVMALPSLMPKPVRPAVCRVRQWPQSKGATAFALRFPPLGWRVSLRLTILGSTSEDRIA